MLPNEIEEESQQPIDNEMIDHLSHKRETLRGTMRSMMLNNDDIDEVCQETEQEQLEEDSHIYSKNPESTNNLSNAMTTDVVSKKTLFTEERPPQFVANGTIP
jgi:hypothetical protein